VYPNQYPPPVTAKQEHTITVSRHQELVNQGNRDLLLIVALGALAVIAFVAWRKRKAGGWT
jgi:hypothetical protein